MKFEFLQVAGCCGFYLDGIIGCHVPTCVGNPM